MIGVPKTSSVTIADGESLSNAVYIGGQLLYVLLPAITSAAITFQISDDGVTYYDLKDDDASGTETTLAASTGSIAYRLTGDDWKAVQYIKVRSGTAASPVNQADGDVIKLVHIP